MDVLIMKSQGNLEELVKDTALNPDDRAIKAFCQNIHGMGETLCRDFFKELCCEDLIKDDIHIVELFKECLYVQNKKDVFETFKKLVTSLNNEDERYTPYYIDKLLWLCCTGQFYEDGIVISKMTRQNFIKFYNTRPPKN